MTKRKSPITNVRKTGKSKAGKLWEKILFWTKRIVVGFFILSIVSTILFRWIPIPVTPLMLIRCVEQLADGQSLKLYKDWEPIGKISEKMQLAVVCSEDQKYLEHIGFDLENIKKAIEKNSRSKKVRGASTISQQTAKNVFLWPGRSWIRKGFEVYFTVLIEVFWSKERILEVYLNVIEMGDGIYGAEAAAQSYFNKPALKLSREEAALIAACLPNPRKYKVKNPSSFIRGRQAWIIRQMRYWKSGLDFE